MIIMYSLSIVYSYSLYSVCFIDTCMLMLSQLAGRFGSLHPAALPPKVVK